MRLITLTVVMVAMALVTVLVMATALGKRAARVAITQVTSLFGRFLAALVPKRERTSRKRRIRVRMVLRKA